MSDHSNDHESSNLEGHTYDGIEELDNQLPNWWLATLYLTMIFAAGYAAYYVIGDGPSQTQEYLREKEAWEFVQHKSKQEKPEASEAILVAYIQDAGRTSQGKSVYESKCSSCHGNLGQGGIGPNLIDDHWLHGGKITSVVKTISDGIPAKGMPPWGAMLKPDEIHNVAAYIKSQKGVQVAGAKAPQGEVETE